MGYVEGAFGQSVQVMFDYGELYEAKSATHSNKKAE